MELLTTEMADMRVDCVKMELLPTEIADMDADCAVKETLTLSDPSDILHTILDWVEAAVLARAAPVCITWREHVRELCESRVPEQIRSEMKQATTLQVKILELTDTKISSTLAATESTFHVLDTKNQALLVWESKAVEEAQQSRLRINLAEQRTLVLRRNIAGIRVRSVVSGPNHTVMVGDGVYSFGENDMGQLGLGDYDHRIKPTAITSLAEPVKQAACGDAFTLFLLTSGHVYSCGGTANGCLGRECTDRRQPIPARIPALLAVDIDAGHGHGLAAAPDGSLFSWGAGYAGQLGIGVRGKRWRPTRVKALSHERVWQVSAGELHSICACMSGLAYHFGEVVGADKDNLLPTLVCGISARVRRVVAVNQRSVILTETGKAFIFSIAATQLPLESVQQVTAFEQNIIVHTLNAFHVLCENYCEIQQPEKTVTILKNILCN